ncbi:hypothetical protein H257_11276 [Aphanomyces astaci]|uniref:Uncharacterized protein n=1 Tax=Aphanomyces astaci TaxID=112090 RepID=W4G4I2_APHAT|nr:hypothetical protein H257_11276 [Aphanomyces astaci]ETV73959.1 hypothetical protein H257_11276 [Aphanomyces astaci]|eukprot:XP_009836472.1 hypothetical protein H257_11276 [Aphanomyces astaci]
MYALTGVVYVTGALLGVTGLVIMYILVSCSHIESSNLLELNCVVGIVWIGRPLLRLRGVTSVCLLSTATVELRRDHQVAHFVVTDLHATLVYATSSSLLVWAVAAVFSIADPATTLWHWNRPAHALPTDSLLLSSGAKYLFARDDRLHENHVYCIDSASALLNGLVSYRTKYHILVMDIKSW